MGMFSAQAPIGEDNRQWVDKSLTWLRAQLGDGALTAGVVLPNEQFFPHGAPTNQAELRQLVDGLCKLVAVDPGRIVVADLNDFGEDEVFQRPVADDEVELTGHYRTSNGETFIDVGQTVLPPLGLVAAIVHELCHHRLPDPGARISTDDEQLVDLTALYLGFGVFMANASFESHKRTRGVQGLTITTSRHGTLSEELYGYALARYTLWRGQPEPAWARYLDTNPRTYLKRALRYLDEA